jgi:hypothetical protein
VYRRILDTLSGAGERLPVDHDGELWCIAEDIDTGVSMVSLPVRKPASTGRHVPKNK